MPESRNGKGPQALSDALEPPPGTDVDVLRYLTMVNLGRDDDQARTIGRLFMRLKILVAALLSIPIVVVAIFAITTVITSLEIIVGPTFGLGWLGGIAVSAAFLVIVFIEIRIAVHVFKPLTRNYRASLIMRSRADARLEPASERSPDDSALTLADLDVRLARREPRR